MCHSSPIGFQSTIPKIDWIHFNVLQNGRHLYTRQGDRPNVGRGEMVQPPLLPAIRICGPFQRDREPHGQYWIDAAMEVSLLMTGADRVNAQSIRPSLREVEIVNCEVLWFKSIACSQR